MKIEDFDYALPRELIAQEPVEARDECRLMRIRKGEIREGVFKDISGFLGRNDVLVLNESKVFPARIFGRKMIDPSSPRRCGASTWQGGKVEILLLKNLGAGVWEVMTKPGLKKGQKIIFEEKLLGEVRKGQENELAAKIEFNQRENFFEILEKIGKTPIPPYIHNSDEKLLRKNYQTVYAQNYGSAAAPTAGLHFTEKLLEQLSNQGVEIETINLNVGLGTFKPIGEREIREGKLHSEFLEIKKEVAERLNLAKKQGKRIIAVGTTSLRALESMSDQKGHLGWGSKETEIFIKPGYKFKFVDSLVTNFHLPKSSLLMLVAAMIGERWREIYAHAIEKKYRFFSFGDAMWIE